MNNSNHTSNRKVAAVYMRVSTANQEEERTIDGQWMEIRDRIEADKIVLPESNIYKDDGWSGTILNRPELDRLRNDATLGKFEALYVYDRGRLSRKFIHQEIILEDLRKYGIATIELHGISGNTPEELMMGSVMGIFHEYERTKMAERMRLGRMRIVKEQGELLGYLPCYGYDLHKTVKAGKNRHRAYFTVNQKEASIVKHIYELCDSGLSMYRIRKILKDEGIRPPRAEVWGNTTLHRMLTNETYIGNHYYNKLEAVEAKNPRIKQKYLRIAKGSRKSRPKSEWLPIKVEPIVSRELFYRVQKQMRKNRKYNPRNNKRNLYLLTGLLYCDCGRARTGDPAPGNHTYYRCTDRLNPKMERKCYLRAVNVPILDKSVWETISKLLSQPDLVMKFANKWLENRDDLKANIVTIDKKLKSLETEFNRYIDGYGKGLFNETQFKAKTEEVKNQKMNWEIKKLETQRQIDSKPQITPEKLAESMVKLIIDGLTFEEKQLLVRKLVERVVANPTEATVYGKIPITGNGEISLSPPVQDYWNDINERSKNDSKNDISNTAPFIFSERNIGLDVKDSNIKNSNQYFNGEDIGLNVKNRPNRFTKRR